MNTEYVKCKTEGCDGNAHRSKKGTRGWCSMHYQRWQKHVRPTLKELPPRIRVNRDAHAFIQYAINSDESECIVWPFAQNGQGYAAITINKKQKIVSRLVLAGVTGGDRPDMLALHQPIVCHNPLCVNPRHLRWGTPLENNEDMAIDGTRLIGTRNILAKLTDAQVLKIYEAEEQAAYILGAEYGVTKTAIRAIRSGKTWSWLTGQTRIPVTRRKDAEWKERRRQKWSGRTSSEIAAEEGLSNSNVCMYAKRNGIPLKRIRRE